MLSVGAVDNAVEAMSIDPSPPGTHVEHYVADGICASGVRRPMLLLAPRYDECSQLLWQAAIGRGWKTQRLDYSSREPSAAFKYVLDESSDLALYGGHIWGEQIASQLGITLLSPPANWLATLPRQFTKRAIHAASLGSIDNFACCRFPLFVKPRDWPQSFASRIYHSKGDLPVLDPDTPVLVQEPVEFVREFRAFVLDNAIAAFSPYSRGIEGTLDIELSADDIAIAERCHGWLSDALMHFDDLPRAVVVDVGVLANGDIAIVEANPAWCSGIYACDPERVLDVVMAATGNLAARAQESA